MIQKDGGLLRLEDNCEVEETEALLEALLGGGVEGLDLSRCRHLHTAILQLILTACVRVTAPPPDPAVAALLASVTASGQASNLPAC